MNISSDFQTDTPKPNFENSAGAAMNEETATQPQDVGKGPNKIEWRSRVDDKPLDMKEQFKNHFKLNEDVYYNGPRGSTGPFKVDEILGNGFYKLRKDNGEKIRKAYDEGDLSRVPKSI